MTIARVPTLLLVLGSAGCVSIQPLRDPAAFIAEASPPVVYVTHNSGALLAIAHPKVSGDSLVGTWSAISQPLALPLNQFKRISAMQRDKTRTTMLITSVSIITVTMGYLLSRPTSGTNQPCLFDGATQRQGCAFEDDARP